MASMISIGVLCDRRDIDNEDVDYFKNRAGMVSIRNVVPDVFGDLGQWQVAGRDQGHTVLGVTLAGSFCEMAWQQVDDLYGYNDNQPVVASISKLVAYTENKNYNTNSNSISNYLKINNKGNTSVLYGDFSVRYWFTAEGSQSPNFWIDYAKLDNSNVTAQFVRNIGCFNLDTYLELKINSNVGTLYPSATTGNTQHRIAKAD